MEHDGNNSIGSDSQDSGSPVSSNPDPVDELLLHRYMEGRLNETERLSTEALLRTSAAARRTLDALREEERLLAESLQRRSEPGKRLGDKVIAALHAEARFRLEGLRRQRLRRQVFSFIGLAACLLLAIWVVKPRESAGNAVSGSSATITTPSGERRALNKNTRFYEGDQI